MVMVTVAVAAVVPLAPLAVSVYVVVVVGLTLVLPSTSRVPLVPGMETEVAFVVVHVRVTSVPAAIEVEEAVKESITGSGGFTVTVAVATAVWVTPPSPMAVSL